MADKNKLKELLKQRATLPQREAVNPVNLYKANGETERPNDTTERVNRTVKTNGISERIDRTETTNGKTERLTERPNARTVKAQPSVLKEIKEAALIEWEYSSEVQRHNGFVSVIGPALGMTEEQIDDLFIAASKL